LAALEAFLGETKYCNWSHPLIRSKAMQVTAGCHSEEERAVALFYSVRDSIIWELGKWTKIASETLAIGRGSCSNKANLLVALLRAVGIPAGFRVMHVEPEYLGSIVPPDFWLVRRDARKPSKHFYSAVHLRDRWIRVDATDDIQVSTCAPYVPESKLVDFDGQNDAMLNLNPVHVLRDEGPVPSIDDHLGRSPSNATGLNLHVAHVCQGFVRREGHKFNTSEEMHAALYRWLARHHPIMWATFRTVLALRKISASRK
jgi:hypothetical protein